MYTDGADDEIWAAIGDPTRRRVLDLLVADGPDTATGLSRQLPVSRQAVAKHLTVLERSGLVTQEVFGREVRFGVDEEQFARAIAEVQAVGQAWDRRLQRIRSMAEALERVAKRRED